MTLTSSKAVDDLRIVPFANGLSAKDESLFAGEDYDFHNLFVKQGYRFDFINNEEDHLEEPRNIAEVVRKHYSHGKDRLKVREKRATSFVRSTQSGQSQLRPKHAEAIEPNDDRWPLRVPNSSIYRRTHRHNFSPYWRLAPA